jgi:hypothetical protein
VITRPDRVEHCNDSRDTTLMCFPACA